MIDPCPQTTDLDQWFTAEILPHESMLTGYLQRVWRNRAEISDLRHDIYVRVYEHAAAARPTNPKAFLFSIARNLLTDRVRRERIVSINSTPDIDVMNVLIDELSPERRLNARQELSRLASALDRLTDKCRTVLWMRRVEGLSQREVAQALRMPETAVESQVARGMRALQKQMTEGAAEPGDDFSVRSDDGSTHG